MRCAITCSVLCICCATLCGQHSSSLTLPQLITRDYLKLANPPTTTTSSFFSHVTVESFGIGPAAVGSGYAFSNAYYASFYNLQGLECPLCVLGPHNLARQTLPPFGANVTAKLKNDRMELFAGFAGIEAWKADGTLQKQGLRWFTTSDGDAWLAQGQAGFRVAVDNGRHFWLGATGRRLYNFGPGSRQWTTLGGDATIRFGR
jgi:hypothetical protein